MDKSIPPGWDDDDDRDDFEYDDPDEPSGYCDVCGFDLYDGEGCPWCLDDSDYDSDCW